MNVTYTKGLLAKKDILSNFYKNHQKKTKFQN